MLLYKTGEATAFSTLCSKIAIFCGSQKARSISVQMTIFIIPRIYYFNIIAKKSFPGHSSANQIEMNEKKYYSNFTFRFGIWKVIGII